MDNTKLNTQVIEFKGLLEVAEQKLVLANDVR